MMNMMMMMMMTMMMMMMDDDDDDDEDDDDDNTTNNDNVNIYGIDMLVRVYNIVTLSPDWRCPRLIMPRSPRSPPPYLSLGPSSPWSWWSCVVVRVPWRRLV